MSFVHKPVLLNEIIDNLDLKKGDYCIDATLGAMGYTLALLNKVKKEGKVLSLDLDEKVINRANKIKQEKSLDNLIIEHSNFRNIQTVVEKYFSSKQKFKAIVADLGLSSDQLADRDRTFSFKSEAKLDMAFSQQMSLRTYEIINTWPEVKLEEILREYGEERFAKSIAKKIVSTRKAKKIETGKDLQEIVSQAVPKKFWPQNINVATKTFQALRILTNEELDNLKEFLPQAVDLLEKKGKLAIVSFHSLEDKIIKHFFKQEAKDCICPHEAPICVCKHKAKLKIIRPKGITASEKELHENPRSRSARLRIIEKI